MHIEKILNTVLFSDDMKEHLLNGGLERSYSEIEEIIFSSPIAIEVKYELLKEIEEEVRKDEKNRISDTDDESEKDYKIWCHNYRMDEFDSYLMNLKVALEKRFSEGVFVCELCDYDEDTVATDIGFECICGSFGEAVEWVRKDINGGEYTLEDTHWHKISLWQKADAGKYEEICSYEFINGVTCYSNLSIEYEKKIGMDHSIFDKQLNLEVPFKAGDIIEVNAFPYAPRYRALVLFVDDNRDCCAVQVLTQDNCGDWQVGGLKHNQVAMEVWRSFSPLYTATIYKGELSGDEAFLPAVSEYINGSEERGREVWDDFAFNSYTLKEFIKKHK